MTFVVGTFKYLGAKFAAKILYMLMFHSLRENSMLPAMVYLINVEDHVKLFKSI